MQNNLCTCTCFNILLRGSLEDNPGPIYNAGVMSQEDLDLGRSVSKIIAETHLGFLHTIKKILVICECQSFICLDSCHYHALYILLQFWSNTHCFLFTII